MRLWDYSSDVIGCRGSEDSKKLKCQETVSLGLEFIAGVMDYLIPKGFESIMHQKLHLKKSGAVTRIHRRGPVFLSCFLILPIFIIVFFITLLSQLPKQ